MEIKIKDLLTETISGEWGDEPTGTNNTKVIRTANFTNEGKIDFDKIVYRDIDELKIQKKKLVKGDIIIEKSGGSPTQPVGRVVFFDIDSSENYLCNNFTTILRPDKQKVYPKFLLYLLLIAHRRGRTLRYQNKTTGILNLKLDRYLNEKLNVPSLSDQIKVANILSKAEDLIKQRKENIDLLDEFLKSTFLKMFGDPVRNEKGWEKVSLSRLGSLDRGVSKNRPRNAPELLGGKYPLVQTGEVTNSGLYITSYSQTYSELGLKQSKLWKSGTMLITIAANIAQTSILTFDACFPDSIVGFIADKKESNTIYVHFLFSFLQSILEKNAPQSAQKNLNLALLRTLSVPKPPLDLQNQFTVIVEKAESLKEQLKSNLNDLENLYGSLSQRAFKEELDLSRLIVKHELEYEASDNDRTEPKRIDLNKVSVELQKNITHSIPKQIVPESLTQLIKLSENLQRMMANVESVNQITKQYQQFEKLLSTVSNSVQLPESILQMQQNFEQLSKSIPRMSIWEQSSVIGKTSGIKFNEAEGDAILRKVFFKKMNAFTSQQFLAFLKEQNIDYDFDSVSNFLFAKIEDKTLIQYYSTEEWMKKMYKPETSPLQDDFGGTNGEIWMVKNRRKYEN